jgi:hypothetical protein
LELQIVTKLSLKRLKYVHGSVCIKLYKGLIKKRIRCVGVVFSFWLIKPPRRRRITGSARRSGRTMEIDHLMSSPPTAKFGETCQIWRWSAHLVEAPGQEPPCMGGHEGCLEVRKNRWHNDGNRPFNEFTANRQIWRNSPNLAVGRKSPQPIEALGQEPPRRGQRVDLIHLLYSHAQALRHILRTHVPSGRALRQRDAVCAVCVRSEKMMRVSLCWLVFVVS